MSGEKFWPFRRNTLITRDGRRRKASAGVFRNSCLNPSGGLKTNMKKAMFVLLAILFAIGVAAAQDVLGPHNVNGHGCASCHLPHSGPAGINPGDSDFADQGNLYLWGRKLQPKNYTTFGGGTLAVPDRITVATDPLFHTAACLSCHDSSVTIAGMTGLSFEAYEGNAGINTYIGNDASQLQNDHPVHVAYTPSTYNWQVTIDANGTLTWPTDANAVSFTSKYGRTVRFYGSTGGQAMVECSTCHNPHLENKYRGTIQGTPGTVKASKWFIRGWFDETAGSTSATAFCRQCHFSKSNEYVNVTSYTVN